MSHRRRECLWHRPQAFLSHGLWSCYSNRCICSRFPKEFVEFRLVRGTDLTTGNFWLFLDEGVNSFSYPKDEAAHDSAGPLFVVMGQHLFWRLTVGLCVGHISWIVSTHFLYFWVMISKASFSVLPCPATSWAGHLRFRQKTATPNAGSPGCIVLPNSLWRLSLHNGH